MKLLNFRSIKHRLPLIGLLGLIAASLPAEEWMEYRQAADKAEERGRTAVGGDKRQAFIDLATLRELSGDYAGAAAAWQEAAFSSGTERDDLALLRAARCLLLVGEFDRTVADIRTVRQTGRSDSVRLEADLLEAIVSIIRHDAAVFPSETVAAARPLFLEADGSISSAIANRGEAAQPLLLYLLYRFGGIAAAADRLRMVFPNSLEALSLSEGSGLTEAATPLLFLFPGREAVVVGKRIGDSSVAAAPVPAASVPVASVPAISVPAISVPAVSVPAVSPSTATLQVGLFRRESNAAELRTRLLGQGFRVEIASRTLDGETLSAVVVRVDGSVNETILKLKDLGLEPFPVF